MDEVATPPEMEMAVFPLVLVSSKRTTSPAMKSVALPPEICQSWLAPVEPTCHVPVPPLPSRPVQTSVAPLTDNANSPGKLSSEYPETWALAPVTVPSVNARKARAADAARIAHEVVGSGSKSRCRRHVDPHGARRAAAPRAVVPNTAALVGLRASERSPLPWKPKEATVKAVVKLLLWMVFAGLLATVMALIILVPPTVPLVSVTAGATATLPFCRNTPPLTMMPLLLLIAPAPVNCRVPPLTRVTPV